MIDVSCELLSQLYFYLWFPTVILEYLQFNMDKCNHLAIKVITDKKIKEVPDYLKDLFESNDEDEKYDLFVRFLSDCGVS